MARKWAQSGQAGEFVELIARTGTREEVLRIERIPGGYRVSVGDSTYEVDRVETGSSRTSWIVDGEQFEVVTLPLAEGTYQISGPHGSRTVEVADRLTHLAEQGAGGSGGRRTKSVAAYMPGRVVAILAEEGAELKAGAGVLVLEAMKMENEIQVEHDGVLTRIVVQEGQAVEAGDLLFELE